MVGSTFNVQNYLRRLDDEIGQHRRDIAVHQVEIARLEDARRVVIGLAEKDATIAAEGPARQLNGHAEKPLLIVREAKSEDVDEAARQREKKRLREQDPKRRDYKREYRRRKAEERARIAAEYGADDSSGKLLDERLDTARKERSDKGVKRTNTIGRRYSAQVERIFLDRPSTPVMTAEVMDLVFTGRDAGKSEKQYVYQALYDLKKRGIVAQTQPGEPYALVR